MPPLIWWLFCVLNDIDINMNNIYNFFRAIYRYCYYKLIIPIKRERREPYYIARGTAVGLFCGFTPIVWQMNIVLLFWVVAKYFKWQFSLPIALAFTWVSNAATNLPLFYLYFVTGRILTGNFDLGSYQEFIAFFDVGIWQGLKDVFASWGVSIVIGSSFYMITASTIGYILTYRWASKRKAKSLPLK